MLTKKYKCRWAKGRGIPDERDELDNFFW